jgi:hypothetical protein
VKSGVATAGAFPLAESVLDDAGLWANVARHRARATTPANTRPTKKCRIADFSTRLLFRIVLAAIDHHFLAARKYDFAQAHDFRAALGYVAREHDRVAGLERAS